MTTAQVSAVVGVLIVGASAYVALMTWLGRPEQPVSIRGGPPLTDDEERAYRDEQANDVNDQGDGEQ